jgi:hypothetical protein
MFFGQGPFMEKEVIEINASIKKQKPSNLMAVLALYFPLDVEKEGFEKIKITQKKFENGNTGVFFVYHNLPDDALKAVKVFLELERQHQYNWKVFPSKPIGSYGASKKLTNGAFLIAPNYPFSASLK